MNIHLDINSIPCQFQSHSNLTINTICLHKDCSSKRLCCVKCLPKLHSAHLDHLVQIDSLNTFIQQESYTYGQCQIIQGLERLLNLMEGFQKIIKDEIDKQKKLSFQEYFKQQYKEQQRGINYWNQLIEGMLQFAKVQNGHLVFQNQKQVQLDEIDQQTINILNSTEDQLKQIQLQFLNVFKIEQFFPSNSIIQQVPLINANVSLNKQLKFTLNPIQLKGHQNYVLNVVISSDGTMIVSGSKDKTVKLWNVQKKEIIQTFQCWGEVYGGVALSSNNQYLAYGGSGDYSIQLHDLKQNNHYATLKGHKSNISTISFSQDSQLLYSGGVDNKLIVWNISQQTQIYSFDTDSYIWTIVNSPDNKLISCICNKSINVWDYSTKIKLIYQKNPHQSYGYGLCSSKDSSMFISSGEGGLIKIWVLSDSQNNRKFLKLIRKIKAAYNTIFKVILTPDEQYLVSICNSETKIMIHEIQSGNLIQELHYGDGKAKYGDGYISISKDMNFLVSGGEDKLVKIWKRE